MYKSKGICVLGNDTIVTHGVKIFFHVFAITVCFMSPKIFILTVQNWSLTQMEE